MAYDVAYRLMTVDDIDQVVAIEEEAFPTPWTKEIFEHEMSGNNYAHYLVATVDDQVIGHCGMWIVLDECHITNIAVLQAYRGNGIGEQLLKKAQTFCREMDVALMTLEVRVSNDVAQNMYRKLGFQDGGIRKNYYTDNRENARVMWVEL